MTLDKRNERASGVIEQLSAASRVACVIKGMTDGMSILPEHSITNVSKMSDMCSTA